MSSHPKHKRSPHPKHKKIISSHPKLKKSHLKRKTKHNIRKSTISLQFKYSFSRNQNKISTNYSTTQHQFRTAHPRSFLQTPINNQINILILTYKHV